MPKRIFLSYGRGDDHDNYDDPQKSFMRRLYNHLKAVGFAVWWDREDLPARGLEFLPEIARAIEQCDRLVLVVGPHAAGSKYVELEWRYALDNCLPVNPLLRKAEPGVPEKDVFKIIPADVGNFNAPDFRDDAKFAERLADLLRLLNDDETPQATLHGVPLLPTGYIRRDQVTRDLHDKIRAGVNAPIVVTSQQKMATLYGVGGIGKSTLAAAVARECDVRRDFTDGVFWLEMGQTAQVVDRMADVGVTFGDLREHYKDTQSATVRLSSLLARRHALLILDDVWDHADAKPFADAMGSSRLLVTTRQGGIVSKLGATGQNLLKLTEAEAVALIAARLQATPDAATDALLRQIARLLDGHTLAVSLAAAWLDEDGRGGLMAAGRLLKRLEQGRLFEDLQMDAADKNQNLELCLFLSYDDLGGADAAKQVDLQRRFRATGVFAQAGTFDLPAAAAVWGDADPEDAETPLTALTRAGLLERVDGRYQRHGLLRTYARALCSEAERHAAAERHFAHYIAAHGDPGVNNDPDRHPLIALDFNDMRAALEWGLVHQPERACDLTYALEHYLLLRESLATRRTLLEAAHEAANRVNYVPGQANTLQLLGDLSVREDDLGLARGYYERAMPVYEQIGNQVGQANTLRALGDLSVREDDLGLARGYYGRALPVYEQIGNRVGQANTLQALGDLSVREDDLGLARGYYGRALPVYEQIGSRLGQANTLRALGDLSVREDDLGLARGYYERAMPVYEQIGARLGQANTLRALGDLSVREDDLGLARGYYERAMPVYEQIGDRLGQANVLKALGDLSVREADLARARGYYGRALPVYEQIGSRLGQANVLKALGDLSVREDDLGLARGYYGRALPVYEAIGDRLGQANTLMRLGDMHVGQQAWAEAVVYYEQTLPITRAIQARLGTANILVDLGRARFELGDHDGGIRDLREALALYTAIQERRWAGIARQRLVDLLRRAGQDAEADEVESSGS